MNSIIDRIKILRARVAESCVRAGRSADSVCIIAVAKTHPAAAVRVAIAAGLLDIGENYLQESIAKMRELSAQNPADCHPDPTHGSPAGETLPTDNSSTFPTTWHFIGKLQSNKSRIAAENFDWVHTVHSLQMAKRLSDAREGMHPLNICLQVNIDNEEGKNGVSSTEVFSLANNLAQLPNLRLRGLMALPRPQQQDARAPFRALATLFRAVAAETNLPLDTLSMGMSADFDAAIAEGATHIRIGSAIFGAREEKSV